jgi:hypothetical protein
MLKIYNLTYSMARGMDGLKVESFFPPSNRSRKETVNHLKRKAVLAGFYR